MAPCCCSPPRRCRWRPRSIPTSASIRWWPHPDQPGHGDAHRLVGARQSPLRDLADLIAKAKASPGKYTFGSGGVGTGNHLAGEFLKKLAGIDLLHVPFRGVAPTMTALYAGDIDLVFSSAIETLPQARDGRVRVLGIGSTTRMPELPDTPARSANWCRAMS